MSDDPRRSLPIGIIAAVSSAAVAVGAGVAWLSAGQSPAPIPSPSPVVIAPSASPSIAPSPSPTAAAAPQSPTAQPTVSAAPSPPIDRDLQLYWLKDTGTRFVMAGQPAKPATSNDPEAIVRSAIEQLLNSSPIDTNLSSAIPPNTRLLGLTVSPEGVRVNLSAEFTSGGGTAAMTGRLGQIIYTSTTLNPGASAWISVEGQPLTVLGGEGIEVSQPITRAAFDRQFAP
ncbi:MAG: spore germination protein [Oscillatoriales cyanobacterium]|nr:MAG: spore germination protein [Oscillatoriales cyanobacterium]